MSSRSRFFLLPGFLAIALVSCSQAEAQEPAEPTCPRIKVGMQKRELASIPRKGDLVPAEALDEKPVWASCALPEVKAGSRVVVRLALTFDEEGKVADVKHRGPAVAEFFHLTAKAAREWRISPPRVKGVPVKTMISYDVVFNP